MALVANSDFPIVRLDVQNYWLTLFDWLFQRLTSLWDKLVRYLLLLVKRERIRLTLVLRKERQALLVVVIILLILAVERVGQWNRFVLVVLV